MAVVHVGGVAVVVADGVFPVATLPDAALGFGVAAWGARFGWGDALRESGFDGLPAGREIGVALGEGPECVHVVG